MAASMPVITPATLTARQVLRLPTPADAADQQRTDAGIKLAIILINHVVLTPQLKLIALLNANTPPVLPALKTAQPIIPVVVQPNVMPTKNVTVLENV